MQVAIIKSTNPPPVLASRGCHGLEALKGGDFVEIRVVAENFRKTQPLHMGNLQRILKIQERVQGIQVQGAEEAALMREFQSRQDE